MKDTMYDDVSNYGNISHDISGVSERHEWDLAIKEI